MEWTTLESRTIIRDRWINLRADRCQMPNGHIVEPFYVLQYPEWLNAVALTEAGEVILTKQYRHGLGQVILELPSGTLDPEDDSPAAAMARELLEETGYVFTEMIPLATVSANPVNNTNLVHCFLARGGRKVAEPSLDDTEEISVELVSLAEFRRLLDSNALVQAVHVTAAYYALQKLLAQ